MVLHAFNYSRQLFKLGLWGQSLAILNRLLHFNFIFLFEPKNAAGVLRSARHTSSVSHQTVRRRLHLFGELG